MTNWLLKIFAGAQTGAEVPLSDGQYLLGASDDCDLILIDSAIAAEHVVLNLDENGCSVEPRDGAVSLDGTSISTATVLAPFAMLTLGQTQLAIGPADAAWPTLEARPMLATSENQASGSAAESEHESGVDVETEAQESDSELPSEAQSEPEIAQDTDEASATTPKTSKRWPLVAVAVAALICISLLPLVIDVHAEEAEVIAVDVQINQILEEFQNESLYLDDRKGRLRLHGFVADSEAYDQVREALAAFPELRFSLRQDDQLLRAALDVIALRNVNVDATIAQGHLVLEGYIYEPTALKDLEESVRRDVPGLRTVENRAFSRDDIASFFETMLAENRLELKPMLSDEACMVEGRLDEAGLERWAYVRDAFQTRFAAYLPLKESFNNDESSLMKAPKRRRLSLPEIVGISHGRVRFLTLADGSKLFEGSRLDGYLVEEIRPGAIALRQGDRTWIYNLEARP